MNRKYLLNFLGWIFCVYVLNCGEGIQVNGQGTNSSSLPPTKYKIDGNFNDWKNFKTMDTSTIDWSTFTTTFTNIDEILLKKIYYDYDNNYLYLFFKFAPSIQEVYDKQHKLLSYGGPLYIDTDANTNTGCTDWDTQNIPPPPDVPPNEWHAGNSTIPGAEIQVSFGSGWWADSSGSGCTVYYEIERWDAATKTFANHTVRKEESSDASPLIAHGKDGVEAALLLSDLQLSPTNKFALTFWIPLVPNEFANREVIQFHQ